MVLRLGLAPLRALSLAALVAVAGCTPGPEPSAPVSPTPTPSVAASASPDPTPTVDTSAVPQPSGWEPRPQDVDDVPGIDTAWATERDVEDVMAIVASFACVEAGELPHPTRVLEGTYRLPDGADAVVEVLEFGDPATVAEFAAAYEKASLDCGAEAVAPGVLSRDVAGAPWTEAIVTRDGAALLGMVSGALDAQQARELVDQLS